MEAPDKIYLAFEDGFVAQSSTIKKDANGNNIFLSEYIPIEYIRKDALLEWAKGEIMPGNSAEGKGWNMALQTLIDKINSL